MWSSSTTNCWPSRTVSNLKKKTFSDVNINQTKNMITKKNLRPNTHTQNWSCILCCCLSYLINNILFTMRTRSTVLLGWADVIVNGRVVVVLLVMHVSHVEVVQVVVIVVAQISHPREATDIRWRCSCRVICRRRAGWAKGLLIVLQLLCQIVLKRVEYGDNCGRAKSMRYQTEVRQMTLNTWLKNGRWFWVTFIWWENKPLINENYRRHKYNDYTVPSGDLSQLRRSVSSLVICLVAMIIDFLDSISGGSEWCLATYSADCRDGNSFSQTKLKSRAKWIASPSTSDVSKVTVAAFLLPAGRLTPIFSSLSLSIRPPFFDLARRKIPPRSEAFRHSGGDKRRWTSPTVTLYLELELRRDRRPGTWQKTSPWVIRPIVFPFMLGKLKRLLAAIRFWLKAGPARPTLLAILLALLLLHEPEADMSWSWLLTKLGSLMSSSVLLLWFWLLLLLGVVAQRFMFSLWWWLCDWLVLLYGWVYCWCLLELLWLLLLPLCWLTPMLLFDEL